MDDRLKTPEAIPWNKPAQPVPVADILALKKRAEEYGTPIGEAFPNVAELLDDEGRRTGILVRLYDGDPMADMKIRPEYPRD